MQCSVNQSEFEFKRSICHANITAIFFSDSKFKIFKL